MIFDTLIKESKPEEVEAVLGARFSKVSLERTLRLTSVFLTPAHELGHWYYMHPTKLLLASQLHVFTILALFPAFMHAPPFLRAFDFPKEVAAQPPTIIAFLLFQVYLTSLI